MPAKNPANTTDARRFGQGERVVARPSVDRRVDALTSTFETLVRFDGR